MRMHGQLDHYSLLQYVDNFRVELFRDCDVRSRRKSLGQFFTPVEVAQQMAQSLDSFPNRIRVIDPGAGAGMLSAALVSHILSLESAKVQELEIVAYEIDRVAVQYLAKTFQMCRLLCERKQLKFTYAIYGRDFIRDAIRLINTNRRFDVAIMNPPYRKIKSGSDEWKLLREHSVPHSNLYTAFMTLATILLKRGGQLISITPRSFCNGPYFLPFRRALLSQMTIASVHVYTSRTQAFEDDGVLQENIILQAVKSQERASVKITSSAGPRDRDICIQEVGAEEVVSLRDRNLVIHLARNMGERKVNEIMRAQECDLADLNISISTGRVVEFRSKDLLRMPFDLHSVPLLLPVHLVNGYVKWPLVGSKKPSAIDSSANADKLLVKNDFYVLVKRFTSKEQRRRLTAAVLDRNQLDFDKTGIENHLNYFHKNGSGLSSSLAKGLAAYLNSSIVDRYFRLFSGHTQVNATDLRNLRYPDAHLLEQIGENIGSGFANQDRIDQHVIGVLGMQDEGVSSDAQTKIDDALQILKAINVPRGQQNNRSALTLLSLVDIKPDDDWADASAPLRRITEMMDFFSKYYGITYAPNTRETVRRQTIHQFWQMGIVIHNPDDPNRPVNSPYYCYQVTETFLEVVRNYRTPTWENKLTLFRIVENDKLTTLEERKRTMSMIPVTLPDGSSVKLSSGGQNELIKSIIEEFCPRYAKGGEVLYFGDAGEKLDDAQIQRLQDLGIDLDKHGKAPDVIVYLEQKNWLILIEAVTSHGPIDRKRQNELIDLFAKGGPGVILVTAFQTRQAMTKYLSEISWETEVWIADAPDHLIHFDGERFLGPYY